MTTHLPIFSYEDRLEIVTTFYHAYLQGKARINSWDAVKSYINANRVKLLLKMSPNEAVGLYKDWDIYGGWVTKPTSLQYSANQAKRYFLYLIDVISGAEKTSEDTIKEAVDQLFKFINASRDSIVMQVELMTPHNWEDKLADLQETMDKRNEKIMDVLEKIGNWQKKYQPYLDEVRREKKEQKKLSQALKKK